MRIGRSVFAVGWRTDAGGAPTTCRRSGEPAVALSARRCCFCCRRERLDWVAAAGLALNSSAFSGRHGLRRPLGLTMP